MEARANKHKLGARVGKYKLGARVGKYRLSARARGQAEGRGPGNTNTRFLQFTTVHVFHFNK